MPIKPENRKLYPPWWKWFSVGIRCRAGGRCECRGECGVDHAAEARGLPNWDHECWRPLKRCRAENGRAHPVTGSKVVLTVAHLDHDPTNNHPRNVKAMCQRCHNRYDADHRAATRRKTRSKQR